MPKKRTKQPVVSTSLSGAGADPAEPGGGGRPLAEGPEHGAGGQGGV